MSAVYQLSCDGIFHAPLPQQNALQPNNKILRGHLILSAFSQVYKSTLGGMGNIADVTAAI